MLDHNSVKQAVGANNELGTVICKYCGEVLYTLPTNGVKKLYGVCGGKACKEKNGQSGEDGK